MSESINQTIDQSVSESVSQQVRDSVNKSMSEGPVLQQSEDCFVEDSLANTTLDTLWPIQNGRCFADNILNTFFSNENVWFSIKNFIGSDNNLALIRW